MKQRPRILRAKTPTRTFTNAEEILTINEEFSGAPVVASVFIAAIPGLGGWITAYFTVDGVLQGQNPGIYQSGGSLQFMHSWILAVPPGMHKVTVVFGTSAAPIASCIAELVLTELAS